ncbi:MAG: hypothetical protein ABR880_09670 [Candidatus Sulfotelmatobacter sp.]|jgi:hypothetical protein
MGFRRRRLIFSPMQCESVHDRVARHDCLVFVWLGSVAPALVALLLFLSAATIPLAARSKEKITYGEGLIINIPMPESEVEQVVEDVAGNGLIRGTREYNKDEFIAGAKPADSSHVFPPWDQGGKVFYKVRMGAIDPRNFKESSDVGTLAVRYVVQPQGEKNTVLRIDALFEEDFRKTVHQSDGSVESAEYKDIREHLDTIEVMKAQNAEAAEERLERLRKKQNMAMQNSQAPPPEITGRSSSQPTPSAVLNEPDPAPAPAPQEPALSSVAPAGQTLEERVRDLRKQVERLVKSPGAPLKSAPFHTASTLQLLSTGTEILIVISTPYWYGVETHEGQHGWMQRDQLEQLP